MLEIHTLVLKNISYHTAMLAKETGSFTHSLCWTAFFWVMWGPLGSKPKFDPSVTTVSIWPTKMYKINVLLTFLDPEILRLKGVVTS